MAISCAVGWVSLYLSVSLPPSIYLSLPSFLRVSLRGCFRFSSPDLHLSFSVSYLSQLSIFSSAPHSCLFRFVSLATCSAFTSGGLLSPLPLTLLTFQSLCSSPDPPTPFLCQQDGNAGSKDERNPLCQCCCGVSGGLQGGRLVGERSGLPFHEPLFSCPFQLQAGT